jgi:hypothetical protein
VYILYKDVWKLKKAIVISAVIIVSIVALIVGLSRIQPTTQPTQPTRVNLTDSYGIVNGKYLILNNGNVMYYNITITVKLYAPDSTFTVRTLHFNQTETLSNIGYTYGIRLPNISASQIDITSITAETFK